MLAHAPLQQASHLWCGFVRYVVLMLSIPIERSTHIYCKRADINRSRSSQTGPSAPHETPLDEKRHLFSDFLRFGCQYSCREWHCIRQRVRVTCTPLGHRNRRLSIPQTKMLCTLNHCITRPRKRPRYQAHRCNPHTSRHRCAEGWRIYADWKCQTNTLSISRHLACCRR